MDPDGCCDDMKLHGFVAQVAAGVGLILIVQGPGGLAVRATLDRQCSRLQLAFMGVEKDVPLAIVDDVAVKHSEAEWNGRKRMSWMVDLAVQGGDQVSFLFEDTAQGKKDASYFASCMRALSKKAGNSQLGDENDAVTQHTAAQELPDLVTAAPRAPPLEEPLVSLDP